MKKQAKTNLLAVGGVICTVLGVMGAIPTFLQQMYGLAGASSFLVVVGLILLAIAFGD